MLKQKSLFVLAIFWVLVPIIRVIMPHASIYGGIRQIMEFIPAMSILGGVGAYVLLQKVRIRGYVVEILMVLAFAPIILKLIQIHPYENVYFNPLIGGLSGAVKTRLPYAGNTFGSAYRQGVEWLNDHAENGANIVFAYELIPNFPRIWLRQDLNLYNSNRSGYLRKGEYAMTLQYVGMQNRSYYDNYLEEFLKPVYQIKVDEVSLLTIWKNDDQHLKRNIEEQQILDIKVNNTETGLKIDLGKEVNLSRLKINYNNKSCAPLAWGYVQLSKDNENWERLPGVLPDDWRISYLGEQPKDGHFTEPFVGQKARYINLVVSPKDTCLTDIKAVQAFSFK